MTTVYYTRLPEVKGDGKVCEQAGTLDGRFDAKTILDNTNTWDEREDGVWLVKGPVGHFVVDLLCVVPLINCSMRQTSNGTFHNVRIQMMRRFVVCVPGASCVPLSFSLCLTQPHCC